MNRDTPVLVSHKYRFIFIKTRKTAGTSIEVELNRLMGEDDIVTPIRPPEEGHLPRNFETTGARFYNHMPATEVREALGSELFHRYYKFCVEREPVDKCISFYSMKKNSAFHKKSGNAPTWQEYLAGDDLPIDHEKYTEAAGGLLVDRVLAYENLEEDLRDVAHQLALPLSALHARAKSGFRERVDVAPEDVALIYRRFEPMLTHTRYRFEDRLAR